MDVNYPRRLAAILMMCLCCAHATSGFDLFDLLGPSKTAVHCSISHWGNWAPCHKWGAGYSKTRKRTMTQAQNGGKSCPKDTILQERTTCTSDEAIVDLFLQQLYMPSQFKRRGAFCKGAGCVAKQPPPPPCGHWKDSNGKLIAGAGQCNSTSGKSVLSTLPLTRARRKRSTTTKRNRDILFLMDESGSVNVDNYETIKRITAGLILAFCGNVKVDPDLTRIAVASFDTRNHIHYHFNNRYWKDGVKLAEAVKKIKYNKYSDGGTCIRNSLLFAKDTMFDKRRGARMFSDYSDQMIVLITDGCRVCGSGSLSQARQLLENSYIALVTMFLGNNQYCVDSLNRDLTSNAKCYNFFPLKSWAAAESFATQLEQRNCFMYTMRRQLATTCHEIP